MNKKDLLIVVVLFLLWMQWPKIYEHFFGVPQTIPPTESTSEALYSNKGSNQVTVTSSAPEIRSVSRNQVPPTDTVEKVDPTKNILKPEQTAILENDVLNMVVSSYGGTISRATLKKYRSTIEKNSSPLEMDFTSRKALAYQGIPECTENDSFTLIQTDKNTVFFEKETSEGLRLKRKVSLGKGYVITVQDVLSNEQTGSIPLSAYKVQLGSMHKLEGTSVYGQLELGVDTLSPGGEKVKYWGKKLSGWIKASNEGVIHQKLDKHIDWVAAKNKYFVQTLTPDSGAENCTVYAIKQSDTGTLHEVSASLEFPSMVLAREPFSREFIYYVGPKKLSELKKLKMHQSRIMDLGWLTWVSEHLLTALNFLHDHIWPYNYGLAIMFLTLIIKIVFWPITHKGTESMRRMQELSPFMQELNKKYKDSPQKKQQEIMRLYKEHKVNPLGGCIPMVVQIPVFIGLFYVLRSAIELRFASFLWIKDLSEPERLIPFGFEIPLLGWDALNILPILMAVTMVVQQKVAPMSSPGTGDSQQQQMQQTMMKIMPVMMLFFLYNFASGLALYWTTQNVLMIAQQLIHKKRKAAKEAA